MVARVAILLVCLALLVITGLNPAVTAGGPPECPPYACGPAPYQCGPSPFGPGIPNPLALCSGVLGICTSICGAVVGCPSILAQCLLAPPPAYFGPPSCGPRYCPPPVCAPPPAPQGIRKCKPSASTSTCQPIAYEPVTAPCPPTPCPPSPTSVACAAPPACGPGPALPEPGCLALCASVCEMPFRLCSGVLSVPPPGCGPYPGSVWASNTTFGCYW